MKPEISQKWKEVFVKKPNMFNLYDNKEYLPTFFHEKDFKINVDFNPQFDNFNDYMSEYGIQFDKLR